MRTQCPHCNAVLKIPDGYSASQVKCVTCKETFEIVGGADEDPVQANSAAFIILAITVVLGSFVLGMVSGYFIAQPKRNAAQADAETAKTEIRRLSKAIDEQAQQHISKIAKLQLAARQEQQPLRGRITSLEATVASMQAERLTAKVEKREDLSYGGAVRLQFRIRIDKPLSEEDLRKICEKLIAEEKNRNPHNAISFFFYLPGSAIDGSYTGGQADWAPYGKWSRAGEVKVGDYSKHRLIVKTGSALISNGWAPEVKRIEADVQSVGLPLATQRKIFYDLVAAQDSGVGDVEAYNVIARKYKVEVAIVRKIGVVGALNNWPMPPSR